MQKPEIKHDYIPEENETQKQINPNKPQVINSSKNIRNPIFNDNLNRSNLENYIKRNSPMQSIKTMFNLKKDENNNINNQNNSFYQDFSPKINNNFVPLTPQIVPNDQTHLNKKYFPSKANVCKGNPDSNPKYIIPSSSPIVQYFASGNVDSIFGGDMGFSLENGNSNCFGERISHLSNISQSDMFNCSPSEFFNRKSYGVGSEKNIDGFFMNEPEGGGEDEKNKSQKDPEDELYTVELEMGNLDVNFKDDDNSILNKINEMKNKKLKEKMNVNNSKGHRNSHTNKNNNHHKLKKKESKNNTELNGGGKKEKNENNKKNTKKSKEIKEINNTNIINNKSLNEKNDNLILNNNDSTISPKQKSNDNQSSNEENNHGDNIQNISNEFTKKIEDYLDHFDDHSSPNSNIKKEDNFDNKKYDNQNIISKKNINGNDLNINNVNNVNNVNNINSISNISNLNNINSLEKENILNKNKFNIKNNQIRNSNNSNTSDPNNLNYINGMNIRCTNLNINNFTNLNNNAHNNNYYDQNQQLLNYLQNKNNANNYMINQNRNNYMINDIYNNMNNNMNKIII